MAGDWIKMTVNLPDKPEVWQMAGMLGIDADSVVGKLLRVWAWFDAHTEDGNAIGVTYPLVDRVAGVSGFAEAMALSGWLHQNGSVMSVPHFSRHNGKTAKNRALTNERVARHRGSNGGSNAQSNAVGVSKSVTKTVTREEKRREDIESAAPQAARPDPKGSRLDPQWVLPIDWQAWAESERPDLDVTSVACSFRDFWIAKPGKDGRKADWQATWRNWVRAQKTGQRKPQATNDDPYGLRSAV